MLQAALGCAIHHSRSPLLDQVLHRAAAHRANPSPVGQQRHPCPSSPGCGTRTVYDGTQHRRAALADTVCESGKKGVIGHAFLLIQVNSLVALIGDHPAHQLGRRHPVVLPQLFQQSRCVLRVDGHHQATGGLGVVQEVLNGQLGLSRLHPTFGKVAVAVYPSGQHPQPGQLQSPDRSK